MELSHWLASSPQLPRTSSASFAVALAVLIAVLVAALTAVFTDVCIDAHPALIYTTSMPHRGRMGYQPFALLALKLMQRLLTVC